jgi:hypothetical protein
MPAVMPAPWLAAALILAAAASDLRDACRHVPVLLRLLRLLRLGVLLLGGLALGVPLLHALLPGAGVLLLLLALLLSLHLHAGPSRFLLLHSRCHVRALTLTLCELRPHRLLRVALALEHLSLPGPGQLA